MPEKRLQKIHTKDLKIGMFVHDVGRHWLNHPWPHKSKLITSTRDIDQLIDYGIREVIIDFNRGLLKEKPDKQAEEKEKKTPESKGIKDHIEEQTKTEETFEQVPLEEELPRARKTYIAALEATREFLADTRTGRKINVAKVRDNVEAMIDSTFRNRDASLALIKLKTYDEYTLTHSLNVAVLAISMGIHLNFSRGKIRQLGMGAIFHDLGKMKVPQEILNKKDRLTEEEFNTIKYHPVIGARMLERTDGISDQSISIALHHHERLNGTGYPDGLSGEKIDSFMIISGMSDVYDALSSDRVYHKSILPHEALRTLFSMRDLQFNRLWLERFIQCLGIYPAGTLVRLSTGEISLVLSVNRSNLLKPRVKLLFDSKDLPVSGNKILDLSEHKNQNREIIDVIDPKALGLDLSILL
ncbi:MAG: HD-GYP domain-containing protein [Deltaproteobacteria bacterium]|nr:HD-GYP domain-containing protein [Deltaproteobacteria bacterium]